MKALERVGLTAAEVQSLTEVFRPATRADRAEMAKLHWRVYHRLYKRRLRQRWLLQGLTTDGRVRQYRRHPQLHGLSRAEYQKRYMQLIRRPR